MAASFCFPLLPKLMLKVMTGKCNCLMSDFPKPPFTSVKRGNGSRPCQLRSPFPPCLFKFSHFPCRLP